MKWSYLERERGTVEKEPNSPISTRKEKNFVDMLERLIPNSKLEDRFNLVDQVTNTMSK